MNERKCLESQQTKHTKQANQLCSFVVMINWSIHTYHNSCLKEYSKKQESFQQINLKDYEVVTVDREDLMRFLKKQGIFPFSISLPD